MPNIPTSKNNDGVYSVQMGYLLLIQETGDLPVYSRMEYAPVTRESTSGIGCTPL